MLSLDLRDGTEIIPTIPRLFSFLDVSFLSFFSFSVSFFFFLFFFKYDKTPSLGLMIKEQGRYLSESSFCGCCPVEAPWLSLPIHLQRQLLILKGVFPDSRSHILLCFGIIQSLTTNSSWGWGGCTHSMHCLHLNTEVLWVH